MSDAKICIVACKIPDIGENDWQKKSYFCGYIKLGIECSGRKEINTGARHAQCQPQ